MYVVLALACSGEPENNKTLLTCSATRSLGFGDVSCTRMVDDLPLDCGVEAPACDQHVGPNLYTVCTEPERCAVPDDEHCVEHAEANLGASCSKMEKFTTDCMTAFEEACRASSNDGAEGWAAGQCEPKWTLGECETSASRDELAVPCSEGCAEG